MNKICLLFFLLSLNVFSQKEYIKLPFHKKNNPTFIHNNNVITDIEIFKDSSDLKKYKGEISILKDKPSKEKHSFYNLTEYGIIFLKSKKKLIIKSLPQLNNFFGFKRDNEIYIDGYLIDDKSYKLDLGSVKEVEIIYPDSINKLTEKVLNFCTIPKDKSQENRIK